MSFIPATPGGSLLVHLEADTEEDAWENLLEDAAYMPYDGKEGFIERGYEVLEIEMNEDKQDRLYPLGEPRCDDDEHEWVDPSSEVIRSEGYMVCLKCGALEERDD